MAKDTLLINIYGASGTGKSIAASTIANALKLEGTNAEYCREWVKEEMLIDKAFWKKEKSRQKSIVQNQYHLMVGMMQSGADVIVCDSPLLHGKLYGLHNRDWDTGCQDYLDAFNDYYTNQMNILLCHDMSVPFQTFGRNEDREGSLAVQQRLYDLLQKEGIVTHKFTLNQLIGKTHEQAALSVKEIKWATQANVAKVGDYI